MIAALRIEVTEIEFEQQVFFGRCKTLGEGDESLTGAGGSH
jgi:hypothetical protein